MAKRRLVTYLSISLVDLFIYFYPPFPATSQAGITARGGPEVGVPPWPAFPTQWKVWCSSPSPSGGQGRGPASQPPSLREGRRPECGEGGVPPRPAAGWRGAGLWEARGEPGPVLARPSPGAWDPAPTGENSGPGGHLAPLKLTECG